MFAFAPAVNPGIRALREIPAWLTAPTAKPPTSVAVSTYTAHATEKPRHRYEPRWEADRRIERARLKGTLPMSGIEGHRLSPQSSCKLQKDFPADDYDGIGPRYGMGASRRNRGRKPAYKNKHVPRIAAGLPTIVVDVPIS